jgi:hypothetical protein
MFPLGSGIQKRWRLAIVVVSLLLLLAGVILFIKPVNSFLRTLGNPAPGPLAVKDLPTYVVRLETMQQLFPKKEWAQSIASETRLEKWSQDKKLLESLAKLGTPAVLYNAVYETNSCQPPFCAVQSAALLFKNPETATEAYRILVSFQQTDLDNARLFAVKDGNTSNICVSGDQVPLYYVDCSKLVGNAVINIQVLGANAVTPVMEESASQIIQSFNTLP